MEKKLKPFRIMLFVAFKIIFLFIFLFWYSLTIMTMINDYFRNEFNEYLKLSSSNVKREEATLCYNDYTQKQFFSSISSKCTSYTIDEPSVYIFQDRNRGFECDLFKYMLENVLKIEKFDKKAIKTTNNDFVTVRTFAIHTETNDGILG